MKMTKIDNNQLSHYDAGVNPPDTAQETEVAPITGGFGDVIRKLWPAVERPMPPWPPLSKSPGQLMKAPVGKKATPPITGEQGSASKDDKSYDRLAENLKVEGGIP
jgi:hypothetical protein